MIIPILRVQDYNEIKGVSTKHPLISLIDQSKTKQMNFKENQYYLTDLYMIFIKESWCAEIVYGRKTYDYQAGTMIFMEPGQEFGIEYKDLPVSTPNGYALVFHKDLMKGTSLEKKIKDFHFFSYKINEALHLSDTEKKLILSLFEKMDNELLNPIDKHTRELLVNHIELLLNYCKRYYERQFHTRVQAHLDVTEKLNKVLTQYYLKELQLKNGLPNVSYCADQFGLSSNYFGDLIKQQLGVSAQSFIHDFVIEKAKYLFKDEDKSIKEISYSLGFEYPNHFSRFFKERTGISPSEYRC